jgi:hypothetical protein
MLADTYSVRRRFRTEPGSTTIICSTRTWRVSVGCLKMSTRSAE